MLRRLGSHYIHQRRRHDTGAPQARNCPAYNTHLGGRGQAGDEASQLEDENTHGVDILVRDHTVQRPERQLGCGSRKKTGSILNVYSTGDLKGSNLLGRTIPSNITEAAELSRYLGHGHTNNCYILDATRCLARPLSWRRMRGPRTKAKSPTIPISATVTESAKHTSHDDGDIPKHSLSALEPSLSTLPLDRRMLLVVSTACSCIGACAHWHFIVWPDPSL